MNQTLTFNSGIPVTGTIVPIHWQDTYATHDAYFGLGGLREVTLAYSADPTVRSINNIPTPRLSVGMVITDSTTFLQYQYTGNPANTITVDGGTLVGWTAYGASTGSGNMTITQSNGINALLSLPAGIIKTNGSGGFADVTGADIVALIPSGTYTSGTGSNLTNAQSNILSSIGAISTGLIKATGVDTYAVVTSADILALIPSSTFAPYGSSGSLSTIDTTILNSLDTLSNASTGLFKITGHGTFAAATSSDIQTAIGSSVYAAFGSTGSGGGVTTNAITGTNAVTGSSYQLLAGAAGTVTRSIIATNTAGTIGPIASFTLITPVSPVDGAMIEVAIIGAVTTLNITGTLAGLITGGSQPANAFGRWVWNATLSMWVNIA